MLFLTVSFGIQLAVTAYGLEEEGYACDMIVMPRGLEKSQQKELFQRILAEGQVTRYTIEDSMNFQTALPEEDVNREFCSQAGFSKAGGKYIVPISILILEESSFKAYAKEVDVDLGDYGNPQERKAILVNRDTWRVQDAETQERIIKTFDLLELKRGDRVLLSRLSGKAEAEQTFGAIRIADIVSQKPFGVSDAFGVMLVVPEQTGRAMRAAYAEKLSGEEKQSMLEEFSSLRLDTDAPDKVREILEGYHTPGLPEQVVYNDYAESQEEFEHVILIISVFSGGFIALITLICVANMFNTISTSMVLRQREFAMLQSVGMTPKGFRKMVRFESLFYALKTLLYGLPFSFVIMALLQLALGRSFDIPFQMPWLALLCVVAGVLAIVGLTMLYASAKLKKGNMIDTLKNENI